MRYLLNQNSLNRGRVRAAALRFSLMGALLTAAGCASDGKSRIDSSTTVDTALVKAKSSVVAPQANLTDPCGGEAFFDAGVDSDDAASIAWLTEAAAPEEITKAIAGIKTQNIGTVIEQLSSYQTRYHGTPPYDYVDYLEGELRNIVPVGRYAEISRCKHEGTGQPSLRLRIGNPNSPRKGEIVILGAHLDSINREDNGSIEKRAAPGADDNASGVAVLIEAARLILQAPEPERTIEFHFYAAEEEGMLGSKGIAAAYRAAGRDVIAYLNFDMVAYSEKNQNGEIFLEYDGTKWAGGVNRFIENDLTQIIGETISNCTCGYWSDSDSWREMNYFAGWALEADCDAGKLSPVQHTSADRVSQVLIDVNHARRHVKLAIAFSLELASGVHEFE